MRRRAALAAALAVLLATGSIAAEPSHGLSVFGDHRYPAGFEHFDYVNPDAPKVGTVRLWGLDTFETLNPFILKGQKEDYNALIFDTLMARAMDEPDALYGLVAESVEQGKDRSWVAFTLRPEARFHDGSPITADDVVFTFETLIKEGDPRFRIIYRGVDHVEATGRHAVRFVFKPGWHRDLATRLASLPVLSKAYYAKVPFNRTTFDPPLGSGPYRISAVEPGRSVTYKRVPTYWARDLPVNRGRYNFDEIRIDYYRDRDIALEAFLAGAYDFREEFTSRSWATAYDTPAVRDGQIQRRQVPDETPSGVQAFFPNLRRDKFKDRRVRRALDLAFDFEWTNKTLFYGQYARTNSVFENSDLAAHAPPSDAEKALLAPYRDKLPPELFTHRYKSPVTDGSGRNRANLRLASRLLRKAGYQIRDGKRVDAKGEPLEIEFLLFEASFQRIIGPYLNNLRRLGIDARMRIVDAANFKFRMDNFDFDVIIRRFVQPLTPGIEQRNYFHSATANVPGAFNSAGIADPVVDALIGKLLEARTRPDLVTAVHALDRVLMWNNYLVPQWYKGTHDIAFWNRFAWPKIKPKYDLGFIDTWWIDPARDAALKKSQPAPAGR